MRLIDADTLMLNLKYAFDNGLINDSEDVFVVIDGEPTAEAIPAEWMRRQYPINARYSGDAYMNKAKIVRGVIREYEDYVFNQQVHQTIEEIEDDRR